MVDRGVRPAPRQRGSRRVRLAADALEVEDGGS
jgi:hypothetical protein